LTLDRVPLVAKLAVTSVAGVMLPVPETVLCTTPRAAVTIWREVRAVLAGAPSSSTPPAISAAVSPAPMYIGQPPREARVILAKGLIYD
jgi:hypothetical protein